MIFCATATLLHMLVLAHLDLTLMACQVSTSILCNTALSVLYLGETFIWKYDFTALILISLGCVWIVF